MLQYNFKKITTVPTSKEFINIMLSKTQRKTPTVIHKNFKISRIRRFYMRKVKYLQQCIHDRLDMVLSEFPKLEDLHPFYADLLNTLYNKDHYKLSLGQLNVAKHLVDRVASDYTKLLKYGDSLYRCKQLKRAALGRMVTVMKKQGPPLKYLEDVRQHLSRLPAIDPNTRTLLLCGCPNAGKSSFINLLTRADVEVEPYPFTTKSLYVGHTDYDYLRWQVIDTPGLLDRPFDEMNTIELQAITALAHIRSAIIFFLDASELCDMEVEKQLKIFESIKPLFVNKPLVVAVNKTDVMSLEDLKEQRPEKHTMIQALIDGGIPVMEMSTLTHKGVMEVKKEACDRLIAQRVDQKLRTHKADNILNRVHVAMPSARDDAERKPFVPQLAMDIHQAKKDGAEKPAKKLERHIEEEQGDDYTLDLCKNKDLANPEWKYDKIPQIWEGHNIADFIDPDIEKKLAELEEEERELEANGFYDLDYEESDDEMKEVHRLAKKIRERIAINNINKSLDNPKKGKVPMKRPSRKRERERSVSRLRDTMENLGVDMSDVKGANFTRSRSMSKSGPPMKKKRSASVQPQAPPRSRSRSTSRVTPRNERGVVSTKDSEKKAKKSTISAMKRNKEYTKGESDRHIFDTKPKYLFSGKRGQGKTDRR